MDKNFKIKTINNISYEGLKLLDDRFEISEKIENPDAILVRSSNLLDYEFEDSIKFIGRAGVGVNNIPIDKCSQKGIVVSNAPGANANAVKELVYLSMVLASRDVVNAINWTDSLKDSSNPEKEVEKYKKNFKGKELWGKNLGVIGLGQVGRLVADLGVNLGMNVFGIDPFLSVENALHLDSHVTYLKNLEDLFKVSDYISLHVPLNEGNKNFINRKLLSNAKDGLKLINLARGGLVDLDDLEIAINNGKVSKYVVDFPSKKTLSMKNVINIPHLGASTYESEEKSAKMIVEVMKDYLINGNIRNSINFPDCNLGIPTSSHRICLIHKNIPNMLGQITSELAKENINIAKLLNEHKGNYAYTIVDIDSEFGQSSINRLLSTDGIIKVRIIK